MTLHLVAHKSRLVKSSWAGRSPVDTLMFSVVPAVSTKGRCWASEMLSKPPHLLFVIHEEALRLCERTELGGSKLQLRRQTGSIFAFVVWWCDAWQTAASSLECSSEPHSPPPSRGAVLGRGRETRKGMPLVSGQRFRVSDTEGKFACSISEGSLLKFPTNN